MITSKNIDDYTIFHDREDKEFHLFDKTKPKPINHIGRVYYDLEYENNDKFIKLNLLKINEEYKRLGFAKILIQHVIEYFKILNYERIFVLAQPYGSNSKLKLNQNKLILWYQNLGFIESEEEFQNNIDNHILHYDLKNRGS